MKKKLFSAILCVILVVAMAVPTFAGSHWGLRDNNSACLNVYGNNTISSNRNVCIWSNSNTLAQSWYDEICYDGKMRYKSDIDRNYALNIYRYSSNLNNCDVMPWQNNLIDSAVFCEGSSTGGPNYSIELVNYYYYQLTASGYSNGSDIRWTFKPNSSLAVWNAF